MNKSGLYAPVSLRAKLHIMREQHPRSSEPATAPSKDRLSALIKAITDAEPAKLACLAAGLDTSDCIILVHAFERSLDDPVCEKITAVLAARPYARQLSQAWLVLRNHPYARHLPKAMRAVAGGLGEQTRQSDPATQRLRNVWISPKVYSGLVSDLASSNGNLDTWCDTGWPPHLRISSEFPLRMAMQGFVLAEGTRELMLRHDLGKLSSWFETIPPFLFNSAASNYINQLEEDEWDWTRIGHWVDRYGLPASGSDFWRLVDKKKRDQIQRRIAGRLMAEFFRDVHDPQGRFKFWEGFIDALVGISYPQDRQRVLLKFHSFIVVEFRDVGNAGYIYDVDEIRLIEPIVRSQRPHDDCKRQDLALHRIIHHQSWQGKARAYLRGRMRQR